MRIGFDLDGVILDHTSQKISFASERGWPLKPFQTHSDRMDDYLPPAVARDLKQILYQTVSAPLFFGVRETLQMLTQQKLDFWLISRRREPNAAITNLKYHQLWPKKFSEKNTYFVDSDQTKRLVAQKLDLTHYIDDAITVLRLLDNIPHRILMDPEDSLKNWPDYLDFLIARSWIDINQLLGLPAAVTNLRS